MLFEKVNDFAYAIVTEAANAVRIARGMVKEAKQAAMAEIRAKGFTLCRQCQAELTNFLIANPDADDETTQAQTESLWETCGSCSSEYQAHLEAQAEEWENRSYGESYAEELNANPHRFHEVSESGYRKKKSEKEDWRAWRDDYRCARPEAVTCQGCDTHYPVHQDAGQMNFDAGFNLVRCSECIRQEWEKERRARKVDPNAIKKVMQSMQNGYLIVDEILFVATAKFGITANHTTIQEALRQLWNNGQVKHRKNPFGQDCFALL